MKYALPAAVAGLLLLAGCAMLGPPLPDPREPARGDLARASGPLAEALPPQESAPVAAYRALLERLEPGYVFPGDLLFGTVDAGGYRLGVVLLGPPPGPVRGTVIAYHGYLSFSAYNIPALARLAEAGWAVLAVDLPGHGFSSGPPGGIPDFSSYAECSAGLLAWAAAQEGFDLPRPYVLLGHSAGAAAALTSIADPEVDADAAILLSPLVRPRRFAPALAGAWLLGPFLRRAKAPWEDGYLALDELPLSWVRALGRWRAGLGKLRVDKPLLVVQGEADGFLDWKEGLRVLARAAPGARVVLLPGRGHILFDRKLAQSESLEAIEAFLDDLYPPPEEAP